MRRSALLLVATWAAVGCYETPAPESSEGVLKLTLPTGTHVANGSDTLDISVTLDPATAPGTVVHLEVSSGVLSFGADAASAEARQLDVKFAGAGDIVVPLRVGLVPGPLLVRASAGDITRSGTISLLSAPLDQLALSLDRARVHADGITPINVTAQLTAAGDGNHVSAGTRIYLTACCSDSDRNPTVCEGAPFLSVPSFMAVETDDSATARVLPSVADDSSAAGGASGTDEETFFVVADTERKDTACTEPPSALHARAMVTVLMSP